MLRVLISQLHHNHSGGQVIPAPPDFCFLPFKSLED